MRLKPITLMAMSGVGKTHISGLLAQAGWQHYSCDYLIGTKYLGSEIEGRVTPEDLSALSNWVGQVGKGALEIFEFKRRQKLYIEAERKALYDMRAAIAKTGTKFVNDSTGSLCEIEDDRLFKRLAGDSLFVYIKAGPEEEKELLARAAAYPKPLYFPPAQFDAWLESYLKEKKLESVDEVEPNDFSRWVFPLLFKSRLPKYQKLADKYGITVESSAMRNVKSEKDFLQVINEAKNPRVETNGHSLE